MWLKTKTGETYRIQDMVEGGIRSCPDFTVREGQTIGEAASLSPCKCEWCCKIRSEVEQGQ